MSWQPYPYPYPSCLLTHSVNSVKVRGKAFLKIIFSSRFSNKMPRIFSLYIIFSGLMGRQYHMCVCKKHLEERESYLIDYEFKCLVRLKIPTKFLNMF